MKTGGRSGHPAREESSTTLFAVVSSECPERPEPEVSSWLGADGGRYPAGFSENLVFHAADMQVPLPSRPFAMRHKHLF